MTAHAGGTPPPAAASDHYPMLSDQYPMQHPMLQVARCRSLRV